MNGLPAENIERETAVSSKSTPHTHSVIALSRLSSMSSYANDDDAPYADPREELILQHRQKVRKMALSMLRRWHVRLNLDDLFSVVDLSLCEAARHFNPRKGASFITFTYYYLKGNLTRTIAAATENRMLPYSVIEALEAGNDGSDSSAGRAGNAIDVAHALSSHEVVLPEEEVFRREIASVLKQACSRLSDVERTIVDRMFGYDDQVLDIASSIGYSRCHTSRIKKQALDTLKRILESTLGEDLPVAKKEVEPLSGKKRAQLRRVAALRRAKVGREKREVRLARKSA